MKTNLLRQNHNSPDLKQLDSMLDALKGFLDAPVEPDNQIWKKDFEEIIAFQDNDGSYKLIDSYRVEADARVDYCYMPTYLCAAIIIKAYMTDKRILEGRESVMFFASIKSRKLQTKMANLASPLWRKLQAARQGCLGAAGAALQTYY